MGLDELEVILDQARTGNEILGITGVLIYVDNIFIQILEGDKDHVFELVKKIEVDSRHDSVKVFHQKEETTRSFDGWGMAYIDIKREQMAEWLGLEGTVSMDLILRDIEQKPSEIPEYLKNLLATIASD